MTEEEAIKELEELENLPPGLNYAECVLIEFLEDIGYEALADAFAWARDMEDARERGLLKEWKLQKCSFQRE